MNLSYLIGFIIGKNQHISVGMFYAFSLFACSTIKSLLLQHYFDRMFTIGGRLRAALISLIYKKVFTEYFDRMRFGMKADEIFEPFRAFAYLARRDSQRLWVK